ncbi:MAG: hypothetical protein O7H39_20400 [Gammaproteobacteria bacterium]|nr:hypothetical protein [Gammaproteobacteria bacterium]
MPSFYPNLVTLDSSPGHRREVAILDEMLTAGWGVKDSFRALDLGPQGFSVVIEGEWYLKEPGSSWPTSAASYSAVKSVGTPDELDRWVSAWGETPSGERIFVPEILQDQSVEFLFVEQAGEPIAGLVTNKSWSVYGISNAFGDPEGIVSCIESISRKDDERAIVGYGSRFEVEFLSRFGFRSIGGLQVWVKQ